MNQASGMMSGTSPSFCAEPAAVVVGAVNEAGADADLLEAPRNDRTDEEERK